uniref:Uncharacterized protein n=1 Tax=Solanum tuberosum TaxID=4113 RepID=M1DZB6_SOLTU
MALDHGSWPDLRSVGPGIGGPLAGFLDYFWGGLQMVNHRPPERTVGHPTVCGWKPWVAPLTLKSAFWSVLAYGVLHYLPLGNIRPRMKTKLAEYGGEELQLYH